MANRDREGFSRDSQVKKEGEVSEVTLGTTEGHPLDSSEYSHHGKSEACAQVNGSPGC